jgi:hypothetical protein
MPPINQAIKRPWSRDTAEESTFEGPDSKIELVLTLLRLYYLVLVPDFRVENVFYLLVDLLGFRLLNKNITLMGLQERKWDFANPEFLVLKWKAVLDLRKNWG